MARAPLPDEAVGAALLVGASFGLSCMDSAAKLLMQDLPPFQVVWARYVSQSVLVLVLLAPRLRSVARTRHPWIQALRSAFMFGATLAGFTAFSQMPLADAMAVFQTAPLIMTALAAMVLGETVGPRRWAGVAAGFLGALIIIRPGFDAFRSIALFPLIAASCYATYSIATRFLSRDESVWTSLLYTTALGAVTSTLWLPSVWTTPSWAQAGLMLLMGLCGTAGQYLLIAAFTRAQASAIAPFSYTGLIFAAIWGVTLFGDIPDLWTLTGAALIIGAGVYVWRREQLKAPR